MAKSMIVYGVPGGKTRFAQRIADHFRLRAVVQNFSGFPVHLGPTLYITDATSVPKNYEPMSRSFQSVADEINAAISLTDWQSGPPPMVGEWNTHVPHNCEDENCKERRYWHGEHWSVCYRLNETDFEKNRSFNAVSNWTTSQVMWRGLSAEPIKVTE